MPEAFDACAAAIDGHEWHGAVAALLPFGLSVSPAEFNATVAGNAACVSGGVDGIAQLAAWLSEALRKQLTLWEVRAPSEACTCPIHMPKIVLCARTGVLVRDPLDDGTERRRGVHALGTRIALVCRLCTVRVHLL